jgi:caa(3)-type oxidase subunit IV
VYYVHLPVPAAIGVALLIASVKAALVACYFMHLISERRLIFLVLVITLAFFAALLLLPVLTSVADLVGS